MITQAVDFRNIPDSFHDCLNSLLPIVFGDSAIVRNYKCGTTKASYLLNHAIKDNCRIVTITGMQNNPFSLNIDESRISKQEHLSINVSYQTEYGIRREFYASIIAEGTTSENIKCDCLKQLNDIYLKL